MVAVVGQQPLLDGLVHGLGLPADEHGGRAGRSGGGLEVGGEPRGVGHDFELPSARSGPQIERAAVPDADRLTSDVDHHRLLGIGIAHRDLPGLQDEFVVRRGVFEKRHGSLDAPDLPDDGADHHGDDSQVGEEEPGVVFFPGPAHEGAASEVGPEEKKPEVEPGRLVDPGARGVGVEFRFGQRADDAHDDERAQQNDGQPQRGEEPEDRITFPGIPRRARRAGTGWQHEERYAKSARFGVKEGRKAAPAAAGQSSRRETPTRRTG